MLSQMTQECIMYNLHNLEENIHRIRPYENVIGITVLCSSLLPYQDYFEVALYLQLNISQLN